MNFFKFIFSKTFWIQVVLAIIITIILAFLTMKWLENETNHGQTISVPNLSRLQIDDVKAKLDELNLNYKILDSVNYNPDFPKYSVIEQNPKPGDQVKERRTIYLKLNPSGYPMIAMPDLIRNTKRQVIPTLKSMGFEIGEITYKPDIARDAVLELYANGHKIMPGDQVMKTTIINLVLGSGDPDEANPANAVDSTQVDSL